jgi:hypothetical protein
LCAAWARKKASAPAARYTSCNFAGTDLLRIIRHGISLLMSMIISNPVPTQFWRCALAPWQ